MGQVFQENGTNGAVNGAQQISSSQVHHKSERQSENPPYVPHTTSHINPTRLNHSSEKDTQFAQPATSQNAGVVKPAMQYSPQGDPAVVQNLMANNSDKIPQHREEIKKHDVDSDMKLPMHDRDWQEKHWTIFANFFNNASCVSDVKRKFNNIRTEKLALLVMRAEVKGYKIDQQRKLKWLIEGDSPRGRMPIVKVCKGNYIRISTELTERFGITLALGDDYEFLVRDLEGKKCLILIPL